MGALGRGQKTLIMEALQRIRFWSKKGRFLATGAETFGERIIVLRDETLYYLGKFKPHFYLTRQCMVRNMLPHPFSMQILSR
jgi:hypothetical protein